MKLNIIIIFSIFLPTFYFGQTVHSYKTSSVEYISGTKSIYEFIRTNIIFPDSVKKGLVGGIVFIALDIDSFGQIQKSQIIKGIKGCSQCDKEALRIVNLLPKPAFKPAVENNARIPSKFNLSFKFDLDKKIPIKYSADNLFGNWSFRDANFNKCDYCPDISFLTDKRADLISDKLSWRIEKNKLFISDNEKSKRAEYFLKDSVYEMTFENYFKQLILVGQSTTYRLTRK